MGSIALVTQVNVTYAHAYVQCFRSFDHLHLLRASFILAAVCHQYLDACQADVRNADSSTHYLIFSQCVIQPVYFGVTGPSHYCCRWCYFCLGMSLYTAATFTTTAADSSKLMVIIHLCSTFKAVTKHPLTFIH